LNDASGKLDGNPDRPEIISDIEQAIADKFRALLGSHKTVVATSEVEAVVTEMGEVDDGSEPGEPSQSATGPNGPAAKNPGGTVPGAGPAKRLYKINEGAMLAGVCNGIAAYFTIDPTVVRIVFVVLAALTLGLWALAYFVMSIVIPEASSAEEKAAAHGAAFTAQEFIRRAKAGYYEGAKHFTDRQNRREWKRRFRGEMREWRRNFKREIRSGSSQWQQNQWGSTAGRELSFALPMLSLMRGVLGVLCVVAIIALVRTGGVFGIMLPAGIPLWLGIVLLVVIYQLASWPLKMARYGMYHSAGWAPRPLFHPLLFIWETIIWLGFFAAVVWLANRYSPQAHEALQHLPIVLHHAVDSLQAWWEQK
jgi:phage shock protein PspC (stress-responsive transcriptional regulator)